MTVNDEKQRADPAASCITGRTLESDLNAGRIIVWMLGIGYALFLLALYLAVDGGVE